MKLGGTRIFGYGVLLSSLLSLITPVATRYHVLALVGIRIVQGLFLGVTYPCNIAIWAKWAPPLERSTMVTMAIAGDLSKFIRDALRDLVPLVQFKKREKHSSICVFHVFKIVQIVPKRAEHHIQSMTFPGMLNFMSFNELMNKRQYFF